MAEHNFTPETPEEKQEHIDAMVAKAEGKEAPATAPSDEPAATPEGETAERPAWLPEKFKTPEDLAKAYAALEQKNSTGDKPQSPEGDAKDGDEVPTQADANEAAQKAVEAAGLDMDALGAKIAQNGDLDAADYEALQKQGITKDMVSTYVAGQQAIAEKLVTSMHNAVGGEDQFNTLLEWGAENLSREEVAAFNQTIDGGSEAAIRMALEGLNSRYKAAGNDKPKLLGGRQAAAASVDVFRSQAEMTAAINDPRYARDAAYRSDVIAKIGRSNV